MLICHSPLAYVRLENFTNTLAYIKAALIINVERSKHFLQILSLDFPNTHESVACVVIFQRLVIPSRLYSCDVQWESVLLISSMLTHGQKSANSVRTADTILVILPIDPNVTTDFIAQGTEGKGSKLSPAKIVFVLSCDFSGDKKGKFFFALSHMHRVTCLRFSIWTYYLNKNEARFFFKKFL